MPTLKFRKIRNSHQFLKGLCQEVKIKNNLLYQYPNCG